MTCFSKKDKKRYSPENLWYVCYTQEDLLEERCLEDSGDPVTTEVRPDEDEGKDKPVSPYFHVEIF